jgi:DNA (cytosine-5)-methyltransferase 1
MWKEMARIISEVRPKYCFVENSPMLTTRGLGTILADLAKMGFDAEWGVLSAADVGAKHKRERIWIVAKISNTNSMGWQKRNGGKLETNKTIGPSSTISVKSSIEGFDRNSWKTEPNVCRVVNGMASAMDRLKAIGNGQVPLCAATAWNILKGRLDA